jgi:hypothetical protein
VACGLLQPSAVIDGDHTPASGSVITMKRGAHQDSGFVPTYLRRSERDEPVPRDLNSRAQGIPFGTSTLIDPASIIAT